MKIEQLDNKNQFVVFGDGVVYFQSYNSVCAKWDLKKQVLTLGRNWDYSATTRKHLYIFIDRYTAVCFKDNGTPKNKQLDAMIKAGEILFEKSIDNI